MIRRIFEKINSIKFLKQDWFILLVLLLFCFVIRIWYVGQIKELIFDEFYFVDFAKKYLTGVSFYDIHPPLGKLIIAASIHIVGDNPVGWRLAEVIFGTGFIYIVYLAGRELAGRTVGLLAATIIAFDGMFLVYSRAGLMDIFLSFFIILTFYLFLKYKNTNKLTYLVLTGISLAFAASIKYVGFLLYGAILWIILVERISLWKNKWKFLVFLIIIPILIYCAIFIVNFPLKTLFQDVWAWQKESVLSNLYSTGLTHPYSSKWWSWLWLKRPVCFYFKVLADGKYMVMYALGNPFIWWTALLALPLWVYKIFKQSRPSFILFMPFLVFLIPWAFTSRILYIYHAMPSFLFLVFGLSIVLESLLKNKIGKMIVVLYFIAMVAFFIYFLPLWMAIPITPNQFNHRMWLKSWI